MRPAQWHQGITTRSTHPATSMQPANPALGYARTAHILVRFSFLKHARSSASVSLHTPQYLAHGLSSWHLCSARICCRGRRCPEAGWAGSGGGRPTRTAAGAGQIPSSALLSRILAKRRQPLRGKQAGAPPCSSGAGGFRAAGEPSACGEHDVLRQWSGGGESQAGGRVLAPACGGVGGGQAAPFEVWKRQGNSWSRPGVLPTLMW